MKRTALKRKSSSSVSKEKAKATKLWGEYVHLRDGICARCGRPDGKLDAHHIMIREFNATRTDERNGVLLCFHCHALMHSDAMAAVRYYTRLLGDNGYAELRQKAYDGRNGKYPVSFWRDEQERLSKLLAEVGE